MRRWVRRFGADERGNAVIEMVIGLPAFFLFVVLAVAGARLAMAQQATQAAAADAARSASIARTAPEARAAAQSALTSSLSNAAVRCRSSSLTLDTSGFSRPVGTAASVTAQVTCTIDWAGISVPGLPRTVDASMSSPLDTYRARR